MGIRRFAETARVLKHTIERFVQVTCEVWKGFNQEARIYDSAGVDSVPCKDDQLILVKIDGTGKYIAAGVLTVSQGAKPGEKIIYARDADAALVSKISMLNDGSIITEADGNYTQKIKGDVSLECDGGETRKITGDCAFEVQGSLEHKTGADFSIESGGDYSVEAGGKATVEAGADALVKGGTNATLEAAAKALVKGAQVELNGIVKTTGGTFECGGVAAPTGQGALCAIPYCLLTGAPHSGNIAAGT